MACTLCSARHPLLLLQPLQVSVSRDTTGSSFASPEEGTRTVKDSGAARLAGEGRGEGGEAGQGGEVHDGKG